MPDDGDQRPNPAIRAAARDDRAATASAAPSEARIDEALEMTFPASDPPAYVGGIADRLADRCASEAAHHPSDAADPVD